MWKLVAFLAGSLVLIFISRKSLSQPKSHGFTRFFAWEAILALFLLNVEKWFVEAAAPQQIVSWILLTGSIVPVVWGVILLKKRGQPARVRADEPDLLAFEKTTRLVTSGIYAYIRHPLYSSLLLLDWGVFFKSPSWVGGALALAASLLLLATARADEAECIQFFGAEYQEYMKRTKRFIPFLF